MRFQYDKSRSGDEQLPNAILVGVLVGIGGIARSRNCVVAEDTFRFEARNLENFSHTCNSLPLRGFILSFGLIGASHHSFLIIHFARHE
jgi:hypothetical protein